MVPIVLWLWIFRLPLGAEVQKGAQALADELIPVHRHGEPARKVAVRHGHGGKVTDKTGTPIPGIEVRQPNSSYKAQTGDDGCYELPGQLFSIETTADILFTDTDGPSNGGEFAAQSVPVEFTEADRVSEAEGWCGGSFARIGVDVTLEEDAQE